MNNHFADKSTPFADSVIARKGDPEEMARAIESLCGLMGMTIALAARGDSKVIDELVTGSEAFIHSEAVNWSAFAKILTYEGH